LDGDHITARSLDDFLICIGYKGCYGLVVIVTAVSVNPAAGFLAEVLRI